MMSDKCALTLDASVEEQDSFGSFGQDSLQTLLSLALADPRSSGSSLHIDGSRLAPAPSLFCCFQEVNLIITTGNEESARRRVEFDSSWNDAGRRGEKVTPALDRAITKFLDEVADCCIDLSHLGATKNLDRLLRCASRGRMHAPVIQADFVEWNAKPSD
jgi:hypothetical protein